MLAGVRVKAVTAVSVKFDEFALALKHFQVPVNRCKAQCGVLALEIEEKLFGRRVIFS